MMDARLPGWIQFHLDSDAPRRPGTAFTAGLVGTGSPNRSPRRTRSPPSPLSTSAPSSPMSTELMWIHPPAESPLLQAIRGGDHETVTTLCRTDPDQAQPIPQSPSLSLSPRNSSPTSSNSNLWRSRRSQTARDNNKLTLFQPTALGIFCDQLFEPSQSQHTVSTSHHQALLIAKALIQACPRQMRCPQDERGRTPLLQLIQNAHHELVSIELVQVLLQADHRPLTATKPHRAESDGSTDVAMLDSDMEVDSDDCEFGYSHNSHLPAINQRDADGLDAMDHVLSAIQLGTIEPSKAMSLLQLLMEYHSSNETQQDQLENDAALLVRFFSLGTSFGYAPPSSRSSSPSLLSSASFSQQEMDSTGRLERILDSTRRLLQSRPSLLHDKSALTQCTPLHVALRNYGNFDRLIRLLLQDPSDSSCLVQQRNIYGDLPLHVACAVGVPMDILHLILSRTLQASKESSTTLRESRRNGPDTLIWCKNLAGYTPVDLEWIRHIEAGNGFFSHRSFYPLDSRGVRMLPSGRSSELYKTLLRQAVDQIIDNNEETEARATESIAAHLVARVDWTAQSNRSFGLLLHRIFLIIRSAFHDSFSTDPVDLSGDILHLAAALNRPTSPALSRPIGELIRWQYPEELKRRDHLGRLPLHCCFENTGGMSRFTKTDDSEAVVASEWCKWVNALIELEPSACRLKDTTGRLPLHYALLMDCPSCSDQRLLQPIVAAMASVIETLVKAHPDSVEITDPETGLCPYMLAASNKSLPLHTVFSLLKHAPGVSSSVIKTRAERRICRKRSLSTT